MERRVDKTALFTISISIEQKSFLRHKCTVGQKYPPRMLEMELAALWWGTPSTRMF
jgi:hypothetical protein